MFVKPFISPSITALENRLILLLTSLISGIIFTPSYKTLASLGDLSAVCSTALSSVLLILSPFSLKNSTLYLESIDEMILESQLKLLDFLRIFYDKKCFLLGHSILKAMDK